MAESCPSLDTFLTEPIVLPVGIRYPETLTNATHSTSYLGSKLADESSPSEDWIRTELFERGLGIVDASSSEIRDVYDARSDGYRANRLLADAVSRPVEEPSFSPAC